MLCTAWHDSVLRGLAVLALGFGLTLATRASAADAYESILTGPSQPLTELLPERVLESIEAPAAPVRVAQRDPLDWRPGLVKASDSSTAPTVVVAKAEPEAEPPPQPAAKPAASLQPVARPPTLVSPLGGGRVVAEPDAGELLSQTAPGAEPDPSRLPVQAPRPTPERGRQEAATRPSVEPTEPRVAARPVEPSRPVAEPTRPEKADEPAERKRPESQKSDKSPPPVAKPKTPPEPLTRGLRNLRSRLRTVLSFYYRMPLNTVEHDPWELMHAMLAYELHSRVRDGGPRAATCASTARRKASG